MTAARRRRDAQLIRRLREVGASLGEHREALDEAVNDIPAETLVAALRHLARVGGGWVWSLVLSPEMRAALDELDQCP